MRFIPALNTVAFHFSTFSRSCLRENLARTVQQRDEYMQYSRCAELKVQGYESLHPECENFQVLLKQYAKELNNSIVPMPLSEAMAEVIMEEPGFEMCHSLEQAASDAKLAGKHLLLLRQINSLLESQLHREFNTSVRGITPSPLYAVAVNDSGTYVYFFVSSEKKVVIVRLKF